MNNRFCLSARGLCFLGVLFFWGISQSKAAKGPSVAQARKEFNKLDQIYHSGNLSAEQYLSRTDSLTGKILSEGTHFKNGELVSLLNLYQEIAWSKKKYGYARAGYYLLFLNNARIFDQATLSIYYAEQIKQQRTLWIVIISFSASLMVLAVYLIMLSRSKKAKAQIETLNNMANLQIVAMEEAKNQAVKEEKRRLGQDLHDGLSSSIAAIGHQLEALSMDTEDTFLKNKLRTLRTEMTNVYEATRNKSHEWFVAADAQIELCFEKQIMLLTNSALPDSRYHKIIHIDSNSLVNVDTDTRIALLRIIQEAVTNIIKHAKAKNVDILIYEEEGYLILTINDDGIGLNEKKPGKEKTTLGLESIYRRVKYLRGETNIHSDTKGTEIIISIPLMAPINAGRIKKFAG